MKDKILDKSSELFLAYGFKSVTMDDIASAMSISKKTLYKYFSNKNDLVSETTQLVQEKIDSACWSVKDKGYNAIEEEFEVKAIFKEMFKKAKTSPMYQLKKYYPETYQVLIDREICTFQDFQRDNLTKGIEEKLYREDIDIELITNFYFTLIFGVFEGDDYGTHDMSELLKIEYKVLEYHTRAIATPKGVEELEKQLAIIHKNN